MLIRDVHGENDSAHSPTISEMTVVSMNRLLDEFRSKMSWNTTYCLNNSLLAVRVIRYIRRTFIILCFSGAFAIPKYATLTFGGLSVVSRTFCLDVSDMRNVDTSFTLPQALDHDEQFQGHECTKKTS